MNRERINGVLLYLVFAHPWFWGMLLQEAQIRRKHYFVAFLRHLPVLLS